MEDSLEHLSQHLVKNAPGSIYYIPNFITEEEEKYLTHNVYAAPKPKWTQLLNRRLQNWGGLPHEKGMIPEKLPVWLSGYCTKIGELGAFGGKTPNHILVNEYNPGQGIMPHTDGSLYYPTVSTISLGSHTLLDFYTPLPAGDSTDASPHHDESSFESRHVTSILLERRSLILVRGDMYSSHLHGIKDIKNDVLSDKIANLSMCSDVKIGDTLERQTRISLTIRVVPKVLKTKIFLMK